MNKNVHHPPHYTMGRIEVIDAIESWMLSYHTGNAVKYIARHLYKGRPIEDIEKAIWYLTRYAKGLRSVEHQPRTLHNQLAVEGGRATQVQPRKVSSGGGYAKKVVRKSSKPK